MTLLELLVKELPKSGGWPGGYNFISTDGYNAVWAYSSNGGLRGMSMHLHCYKHAIVTRDQYEAASAASQQPVWDGEGLPPVGVECEITAHNNRWGLLGGSIYKGSVIAYSGEEFWFKAVDGTSTITRTDKVDFRPIRTEANRKREEAIKALTEWISEGYSPTQIYDLAIVKGEIPGVKLA